MPFAVEAREKGVSLPACQIVAGLMTAKSYVCPALRFRPVSSQDGIGTVASTVKVAACALANPSVATPKITPRTNDFSFTLNLQAGAIEHRTHPPVIVTHPGLCIKVMTCGFNSRHRTAFPR